MAWHTVSNQLNSVQCEGAAGMDEQLGKLKEKLQGKYLVRVDAGSRANFLKIITYYDKALHETLDLKTN